LATVAPATLIIFAGSGAIHVRSGPGGQNTNLISKPYAKRREKSAFHRNRRAAMQYLRRITESFKLLPVRGMERWAYGLTNAQISARR
jgi:hypothetical protein